MARTVSSSGFSRRSSPRISAPICLVRGTTSNLVLVMTVIVLAPGLRDLPAALSNAGPLLGGDRRGARRPAVLDLAARQCREDFLDQLARWFRAQLDRDALAAALGLVDEVDTQHMVERRMEGVVVIDVGGVDPHPAARPLGAAHELRLLDDVRAHDVLLRNRLPMSALDQAARAAAAVARCFWKKAKTLLQPSSACSGR